MIVFTASFNEIIDVGVTSARFAALLLLGGELGLEGGGHFGRRRAGKA